MVLLIHTLRQFSLATKEVWIERLVTSAKKNEKMTPVPNVNIASHKWLRQLRTGVMLPILQIRLFYIETLDPVSFLGSKHVYSEYNLDLLKLLCGVFNFRIKFHLLET